MWDGEVGCQELREKATAEMLFRHLLRAQECTELKHQNFSRSTNRMGVALMRESTSSSAVCSGDVLCDGAVVPFKWCGCFSVAALFCSQGHVLYCTHSAAHEKYCV